MLAHSNTRTTTNKHEHNADTNQAMPKCNRRKEEKEHQQEKYMTPTSCRQVDRQADSRLHACLLQPHGEADRHSDLQTAGMTKRHIFSSLFSGRQHLTYIYISHHSFLGKYSFPFGFQNRKERRTRRRQ